MITCEILSDVLCFFPCHFSISPLDVLFGLVSTYSFNQANYGHLLYTEMPDICVQTIEFVEFVACDISESSLTHFGNSTSTVSP